MKKSGNSGNRKFTPFYKDEIPHSLIRDNKEAFAIYFYLKENAAFYGYTKTYKGSIIRLKKKEIVISNRDLATKINLSVHKTRKGLDILQAELMIKVTIDKGFSRIKILETPQIKSQTPSNPLIKGVAGDKSTKVQTGDKETQTPNNTAIPSATTNNSYDCQTQYNTDTLVSRENKKKPLNKKNTTSKNMFTDNIIDHINKCFSNFLKTGLELDKTNVGTRSKVGNLTKQYPYEIALKMEISKYFQNEKIKDDSIINLDTLYKYLMNKKSFSSNKEANQETIIARNH